MTHPALLQPAEALIWVKSHIMRLEEHLKAMQALGDPTAIAQAQNAIEWSEAHYERLRVQAGG